MQKIEPALGRLTINKRLVSDRQKVKVQPSFSTALFRQAERKKFRSRKMRKKRRAKKTVRLPDGEDEDEIRARRPGC